MATLKQHQQQIDHLKAENQRLRLVETQLDDMQVSIAVVSGCGCSLFDWLG